MLIIIFLKLLSFFLRTLTPYSATALPGLILEKHFNKIFRSLCSQIDEAVMVTGTNGKTTTSKMLGHLIDSQHIEFISNPSGSNMLRGIGSTLLDHCNWQGKLKLHTAILEVEEATMPKLVKIIKPKVIIVTNIFRDQLDAYGEVDKIRDYLRLAIEISKPELLILNADDQRVANLASASPHKVIKIGLAAKYQKMIKWENDDDHKSEADFILDKIELESSLQPSFSLIGGKTEIKEINIQTPGIHNVFNAAASLVTAHYLTKKWLADELSTLSPAFGRGEDIVVNSTTFKLLLVKNPAGMNLNLELIMRNKNLEAVLLLLNDNIADGRDVSWIWDCNLEILAKTKAKIYVGGSRCWDLAVRLKYAGVPIQEVFTDLENSLQKLTKVHKKVFVLPTYTSMLEFRALLGKVTNVKKMWKLNQ